MNILGSLTYPVLGVLQTVVPTVCFWGNPLASDFSGYPVFSVNPKKNVQFFK
jgi:hypothetical protein